MSVSERLPAIGPAAFASRVDEVLARIASEDAIARLWACDHSLWPDGAEPDRLGWLDLPTAAEAAPTGAEQFAADARADGIETVVLLGMGGSSRGAEVLRDVAERSPRGIPLLIAETTDPIAIQSLEAQIAPAHTLFIAASKSGSTIETRAQLSLFRHRASGAQFAAITDAGSPLDTLALEEGFRGVFHSRSDVGGRYSVLGPFGLVPAALAGVDVHALVEGAAEMARLCHRPAADNPGAILSAAMAAAVREGRLALTLEVTPSTAALGPWLQQLLAESTGKDGTGIVPVLDDASVAPVACDRRFFAGPQDAPGLVAAQRRGDPTVTLPQIEDTRSLGAALFLWEFATAIAGWALSINPFDQPDVADAKAAADRVLAGDHTVPEGHALQAILDGSSEHLYCALQLWVPGGVAPARLSRLVERLRGRLGAPLTVDVGPSYLHASGQLHKGGPANASFIQVVGAPIPPEQDVAVPGQEFTFGDLFQAQALGDYQSLCSLGRLVARTTLEDLEALAFA